MNWTLRPETGKCILIVDDNATNRSILTLQTRAWGMLPYAYASGKEALAQVQAGVSLAILDMQMPDMDGLVLAVELRRFQNAQEMPLRKMFALTRSLSTSRISCILQKSMLLLHDTRIPARML